MNKKYLIGIVVIVAFMVLGATSFLQTAVRYVSFNEAKSTQHQVQVMGHIDFSTVKYDTTGNCLKFCITSMDSTDAAAMHETLPIVYDGVVPGNFDQAKSVVVRGTFDGSAFHADKMLVKCPSKYQGVDGEYQEMDKHNEGLEKALEGA